MGAAVTNHDRAALLARESAARATSEAAADRLGFLAAATAALSETVELEARLSRLAAAGVPRIADCAVVHLVDGDGLRVVAAHHRDPEREDEVHALIARWPVALSAPHGIGAAVRRGVPLHTRSITDDELVAVARDADHLAALRALDPSASLCLPLRGRGDPVGALTLYTMGGRSIDDADAQLATELAGSAGVLIENAILLEARDRDRASHRYQAALLGALYRASVDGILVVDPDGAVLSRNDRFAECWGFDPGEVATDDDEALLAAAMTKVVDPEGFIERVRAHYADPTQSVADEVVLTDGRVLDRHGAPLFTDDGSYLGWAWTFRDVTAERRQQAEIAAAGERFAALARTLQQSLLPPRLPSPAGIDLAARYHPAYDGIDVGGDFYDVFAVDGGWCIVLGDVCGKGPEAARVTGLVRWALRAAAIRTDDPAVALTELNTVMSSDPPTDDVDARFATLCCLYAMTRPDGGLLVRVASAGHPPPLVLRADGSVRELRLAGTPVGLFDEVELESATIELAVGDGVVLVTDGVLEARNADGEELDSRGLIEVVRTVRTRSATEISAAIEARALAQQSGVAHDDIAVLVALVAPVDERGGYPAGDATGGADGRLRR